MEIGDVYCHECYYVDQTTGQLLPKYQVILGFDPSGDAIVRLLTSRAHGRPQEPRCYHGQPYSGFFVGVLGAELQRPTWIDLRAHEDLDRAKLLRSIEAKIHRFVLRVDGTLLLEIVNCVAGADDTTVRQERSLRDYLATRRS